MSFITFRIIDLYSRWRKDYLEENPDKQLFNWISGSLGSIPTPQKPIVTLGEKGKKIGIFLLIALVLLASSGDKS